MNFVKLLTLCCLPLLVLNACSCKKDFEGVVYDRATGLPLEGVTIEVHLTSVNEVVFDAPVITDSKGHYTATLSECMEYMISAHLDDYASQTWTPSIEELDTVYLDLYSTIYNEES